MRKPLVSRSVGLRWASAVVFGQNCFGKSFWFFYITTFLLFPQEPILIDLIDPIMGAALCLMIWGKDFAIPTLRAECQLCVQFHLI